MPGFGWFPLVPGQPVDPEAFRRASSELRTFVAAAPRHFPIDPTRMVVLGFSQGGVMGFDLTLRSPQDFVGSVALSTWLPETLAEDLPQLAAQRDFPVLMVHGRKDQVLEVERARKSQDVLEAIGVDLTYQEFEMGHEIRPEALKVVLSWLEKRFK
jgi:phospholipase/carboxylesterase